MKTEKNLRPLLFWFLLIITALCALLFVFSKFTDRVVPPETLNTDNRISKTEYWQNPNGTVANEIVYEEEDQIVYKSSFIGEYKAFSINPKVAKISKNGWNLILLNKNYILPDNYKLDLTEIAGSQIKMDTDAASYYNKMYIEASREGIILTPFSGYRTVSFQRKLFENTVEDLINNGKEEKEAVLDATKSVNIPASSEHNAGLSVDIVSRDSDFEETDEYKWLYKNAHKYGFILRYPEGKEKVTGVEFKPYHWRFVGINAAKEMKKSGECLEEYVSSKLK